MDALHELDASLEEALATADETLDDAQRMKERLDSLCALYKQLDIERTRVMYAKVLAETAWKMAGGRWPWEKGPQEEVAAEARASLRRSLIVIRSDVPELLEAAEALVGGES